MPRRSNASLTIASFTPGLRRLEPPPELGGIEAEIFGLTVAAVPATQFQAEDLPLLAAYCRASALERRAAEELQAGAVIGSQASPWLAVHASAVRSLSTLSVRLRLGPRSRSHNVRTRMPESEPSYYDTCGGPNDPR